MSRFQRPLNVNLRRYILAPKMLTFMESSWSGSPGRGLHSSTFRLNLSALYGMGVRVGVV